MLLLVLRRSLFLSLFIFHTAPYAVSSASYTLPPGWKKFDFIGPHTQLSVYYGETERLAVELTPNENGLLLFQIFDTPFGYLEVVTADCPAPDSPNILLFRSCRYNLVLTGTALGQCFSGRLRHEIYSMHWRSKVRYSSDFSYCVVPHPLSLLNLPEQEATANLPFSLSLVPFTAAYQENVLFGASPVFQLEPEPGTAALSALGLRFDASTGQLYGAFTETGTFRFRASASNSRGTTESKIFLVKVAVNIHDKPRFKTNISLPSATAGKEYEVDLSSLLEDNPGFMRSNQLHFSIDESTRTSDSLWLNIKNNTRLSGIAPKNLAGAALPVRITAHSNTGGASLPVDLTVNIAANPELRPRMKEGLQVTAEAGGAFYFDLREAIEDETADPDLKLILDAVLPAAPWIALDKANPLALSGTVPETAAGQLFQLSLHANNQAGGDSEQALLQLKVNTNPLMKPVFKAELQLPEVMIGEPYFYDFRANGTVYPDYEEAPYQISFKKPEEAPTWLRLENNQLVAEEVPPEAVLPVRLQLIIHNSAGGDSDSYDLTLR